MEALAPLRFQPLLKRYLWGGRRLGHILGKPLGEGNDYAESWEIVDHGDDQSIVAEGPLAGLTLRQLLQDHAARVLGAAALDLNSTHASSRVTFPLLFKFLDAQLDLSVQVHPNDQQGSRLQPPDLGKTEAWVILAANPGSQVYAGLLPGIDRPTLESHIAAGTTAECLYRFEPQVGDCLFIPAGTVHALGAGLLVAEIQQASNTTFRLFDWNRVDRLGNSRPLHIEQALEVIDFQRGPVRPQRPQPTDRPTRSRLVECEYFTLDRWQLAGHSETLDQDRTFHILAVVSGELNLICGGKSLQLRTGETCLLPASRDATQLDAKPSTVVLDMYLPLR